MRDDRHKIGVDRLGPVGIAVGREKPGVSVDETKRVPVAVVGGLELPSSFRGVPQIVGDQSRVIIPKSGDRGIANPVERIERMMQVHLSGIAPGCQKRRCHIPGAHVA